MNKVNSNANKIINELKKRGMEISPTCVDNSPNGLWACYTQNSDGSTEFVLSWNLEYKYVYVRVNKNQIIAHSVSTETNMCIWYWQLWLSKKIVNQVCNWITSEVWGD